jgi:hypothetical protein
MVIIMCCSISSINSNLNYTLYEHTKGYKITKLECLQMLVFSPYVSRHWELSKQYPENFWGHRVIACLESIPLIGSLVFSIAERIVVLALRHCFDKSISKNHQITSHTISSQVSSSIDNKNLEKGV